MVVVGGVCGIVRSDQFTNHPTKWAEKSGIHQTDGVNPSKDAPLYIWPTASALMLLGELLSKELADDERTSGRAEGDVCAMHHN